MVLSDSQLIYEASPPMPTLSARLSVSMPRSTKSVLKKLSRLQGRSQAAVVRDVLVEVEPTLRRIAGLLEYVQKEQKNLLPTWAFELDQAQSEIERFTLARFERLESDLGKSPASPGNGVRGAGKPPITNRGVATPVDKMKKGKKA